MSQQRMAGSDQFKNGMNQASQGPGNKSYKTDGPHLKGAGAWDRQVGRETAQKDNAALTGSTGASNLADYINVSKSATQGNNSFSIDNANKYVDNSRSQSNTNKQQNAGFSDNRVSNNVEFSNNQMDNNMARNEGFAMNTTNNFVNNSKNQSQESTNRATDFANKTVDKYVAKNKNHQSTNVGALDQTIRSAPINDKAYSTVQSNNTYGDMYAYGRKELPSWQQGEQMKGTEKPDFQGLYDQTKDDLDKYKV